MLHLTTQSPRNGTLRCRLRRTRPVRPPASPTVIRSVAHLATPQAICRASCRCLFRPVTQPRRRTYTCQPTPQPRRPSGRLRCGPLSARLAARRHPSAASTSLSWMPPYGSSSRSSISLFGASKLQTCSRVYRSCSVEVYAPILYSRSVYKWERVTGLRKSTARCSRRSLVRFAHGIRS